MLAVILLLWQRGDKDTAAKPLGGILDISTIHPAPKRPLITTAGGKLSLMSTDRGASIMYICRSAESGFGGVEADMRGARPYSAGPGGLSIASEAATWHLDPKQAMCVSAVASVGGGPASDVASMFLPPTSMAAWGGSAKLGAAATSTPTTQTAPQVRVVHGASRYASTHTPVPPAGNASVLTENSFGLDGSYYAGGYDRGYHDLAEVAGDWIGSSPAPGDTSI